MTKDEVALPAATRSPTAATCSTPAPWCHRHRRRDRRGHRRGGPSSARSTGSSAAADVLATPLTRKLARFSTLLTVVILGLAALTFAVGRPARGERRARCSPRRWRWPSARSRKDCPPPSRSRSRSAWRGWPAAGDHPPAARRRDARQHHRHLHRQDRHPDREPDDRARALDPAATRGDRLRATSPRAVLARRAPAPSLRRTGAVVVPRCWRGLQRRRAQPDGGVGMVGDPTEGGPAGRRRQGPVARRVTEDCRGWPRSRSTPERQYMATLHAGSSGHDLGFVERGGRARAGAVRGVDARRRHGRGPGPRRRRRRRDAWPDAVSGCWQPPWTSRRIPRLHRGVPRPTGSCSSGCRPCSTRRAPPRPRRSPPATPPGSRSR